MITVIAAVAENNALGKDSIDVDHISALHDLGYLPLVVKGLPEGSIVPTKIPVVTVYNTHPEFFWLTNYLESLMSAVLLVQLTVWRRKVLRMLKRQ